MKLLVFAHIPPPHHGQSYMVKLMLDGLGGDRRKVPASEVGIQHSEVDCYHVNARFSDDMEDIGSFRVGKALLVFRYCVEAVWCRFRYGVRAFYYVPAPGKRAALYRDWMVMILCRPFFRDFIHHWHAVGLGDWLRTEGNWFERWLTPRLLGRPALGIALGIPSMRDALWFRSHRVDLVANGIPDPFPDFDAAILPRRRERLESRRRLLAIPSGSSASPPDPSVKIAPFRVLYLAHCVREKGIFDTLEAIALANQQLAVSGSPMRFHLTVAGQFLRPAEEEEFHRRVAAAELGPAVVRYAGFVGGEEKSTLLADSDCLCFPTYYDAESFGLVVVEAMASGMTIITTRWRSLPDILPADYPGLVPIKTPARVATALLGALLRDDAEILRRHFLAHYTTARHLDLLRDTVGQLVGAD